MKEEKEPRVPKITLTKNPDYKVIYITGVFGALSPAEGRMIFYLDRPIPKMKDEPPGAMEVAELERELLIEVHMPATEWISMAEWMQDHIRKLKEKGILISEAKITRE